MNLNKNQFITILNSYNIPADMSMKKYELLSLYIKHDIETEVVEETEVVAEAETEVVVKTEAVAEVVKTEVVADAVAEAETEAETEVVEVVAEVIRNILNKQVLETFTDYAEITIDDLDPIDVFNEYEL